VAIWLIAREHGAFAMMGGIIMRVLGWMLSAVLLATPLAARAQTEAVYPLGHFTFEEGGEIPDMKVGYVTRAR